MKNLFILGLFLFSNMAMAGHADNLRLNTFLSEAFAVEEDSGKLTGTNSDNEYCDVRFSIGHHLFLDNYQRKSAATALYDVKVIKLDNLNSIKFQHKRVIQNNRIIWTETHIQKTESGYKFIVTFRRGIFKKLISSVNCTITQ